MLMRPSILFVTLLFIGGSASLCRSAEPSSKTQVTTDDVKQWMKNIIELGEVG